MDANLSLLDLAKSDIMEWMLVGGEVYVKPVPRTGPVSYTHLDVYKRQDPGRSAGGAGGAAAAQRPRGRTAEKAGTEVRGTAGRVERGTRCV